VSAPASDTSVRRHPELLVGTSGWSYDHWAGPFYPDHLPATRRLEHYANRFRTVEINATFYRLPSERTIEKWRDSVPEDFAFAVKGSRLITHYRKLVGAEEALKAFLERMRFLGPRLAVVLWQLPPALQRDDDTLERFLGQFSETGVRHAIEFRHESWLAEEVYDLLRRHDVALVSVSGDQVRTDMTSTTHFIYARFHGIARYHGAYERSALRPWVAFLREQLAAGRDCYAYFNNDAEAHAPADAARLMDMMAED